jgi:hypothetical protein
MYCRVPSWITATIGRPRNSYSRRARYSSQVFTNSASFTSRIRFSLTDISSQTGSYNSSEFESGQEERRGFYNQEHPCQTFGQLPPEADVDTQTFREWGNRSNVILPILIGEIFLNALERSRGQQDLEDRLRFERFISDLSGRFVNIEAEEVGGEITESGLAAELGVTGAEVFRDNELN